MARQKTDIQDIRSAVVAIKKAILQSQYAVAKEANRELLSLYYGIGGYVSTHTRGGAWGVGAIDAISQQLQKELPGLRGFSASAIKRMRSFYEAWSESLKRPLPVGDLHIADESVNTQELTIRPLAVGELNWSTFLSLSFTHHP